MTTLDFKEVEEQSRTYHFPNGVFSVNNVKRVAVSKTTHRLETTDNRLYIIANGWFAIEIDAPKWSF